MVASIHSWLGQLNFTFRSAKLTPWVISTFEGQVGSTSWSDQLHYQNRLLSNQPVTLVQSRRNFSTIRFGTTYIQRRISVCQIIQSHGRIRVDGLYLVVGSAQLRGRVRVNFTLRSAEVLPRGQMNFSAQLMVRSTLWSTQMISIVALTCQGKLTLKSNQAFTALQSQLDQLVRFKSKCLGAQDQNRIPESRVRLTLW